MGILLVKFQILYFLEKLESLVTLGLLPCWQNVMQMKSGCLFGNESSLVHYDTLVTPVYLFMILPTPAGI